MISTGPGVYVYSRYGKLQKFFAAPPTIKGWSYLPHPLDLDWPCDLFWTLKHGWKDTESEPQPQEALLAFAHFLGTPDTTTI